MIKETIDAQILKDAKGIFEKKGGAVGVECDNQGRGNCRDR